MSENDAMIPVRPESPAARYLMPILTAFCDTAGALDTAVYHLSVGDNPPVMTMSIMEAAGLVGSVGYELERLAGVLQVLTTVFAGEVMPPNPDVPVERPTIE